MSIKTGREFFWPSLDNIDQAKAAANQGWAAAGFCSIVTAVGVFINWDIIRFDWLPHDHSALFDAFLFAIIGWGIFRKVSRFAAVSGLILYLLERIYSWSVHGTKSPGMAILLILMFVNSVRGTFIYKKLIKESETRERYDV